MPRFVEQFAVERSAVEPVVLDPALDEAVPAVAVPAPLRAVAPVAGLGAAAVEPDRVPPSLRRGLPVMPAFSVRQDARRLTSSPPSWHTCEPR